MNKKLTQQANHNKSCPEKVYNVFKVDVAMYGNYSVKFIKQKNKKKRNSKYCNKTLPITYFKMNK